MNIAPAHSYSALPAWLIDVPSGITKLAIRSDTPARFSRHSRLSGSVAADEAVENDVSNAGAIAGNNLYGRATPTIRISNGTTSPPYTAIPTSTHAPKASIGPAACTPDFA